ncbi:hypothetical protein TNCV_2681931 [Trichonephila clavipes]|nr:hypothetical protein TNCV_2681931 [Trichonephila clavipes]
MVLKPTANDRRRSSSPFFMMKFVGLDLTTSDSLLTLTTLRVVRRMYVKSDEVQSFHVVMQYKEESHVPRVKLKRIDRASAPPYYRSLMAPGLELRTQQEQCHDYSDATYC